MKNRRLFHPAWWLGFVLLFGFVQRADAGGWVVVTVTSLPEVVTAGEPFEVTFAVRGHGQDIFSGIENATVTAVHAETGAEVTETAVESKQPGMYQAALTLPQSGEWSWKIQMWHLTHRMPPLWVNGVAPSLDTAVQGRFAMPISIMFVVTFLSSLGTVGVFALWLRSRQWWQLGAAGIFLIASVVGAQGMGEETAVAQTERPLQKQAITDAAMGEALFVSKGCITCHQHDGVTMGDNLVPFGPNLTHYNGDQAYLTAWLSNPAAIKPETQMPRLYLSEEELDILVQFLSQS